MPEISIVGLNRDDQGRNCENHIEACGKYVQEDDLVSVVPCICTFDNKSVPAVKVNRVSTGFCCFWTMPLFIRMLIV